MCRPFNQLKLILLEKQFSVFLLHANVSVALMQIFIDIDYLLLWSKYEKVLIMLLKFSTIQISCKLATYSAY